MLALAGDYSKEERLRKTGWLRQFKGRKKEEHICSHCKIYKDIRNTKLIFLDKKRETMENNAHTCRNIQFMVHSGFRDFAPSMEIIFKLLNFYLKTISLKV